MFPGITAIRNGPFKLIGGTSKGHPDDTDIRLGAEFVRRLMQKTEPGLTHKDSEPEGLQMIEHKSIDTLIFDVDGTLWDTSEIVAGSWTRAVQENSDLGYTYTAAYLREQAFGKPMHEIARLLLPGSSEEEIQRLSRICFEYEDRDVREKPARIYEGLKDTLTALSSEGYRLYIVSNCQIGYIEACMDQCDINGLILDHLCYGETGDVKCVTIQRLMQRNGIDASRAVYIGDTRGDQEASACAGLRFIHAAYGFGRADAPDYELKDIRELPELMREINGG